MTVPQQSSYSHGQQILGFHTTSRFINGLTKEISAVCPEALQFSQATHTQVPNLMSFCCPYDRDTESTEVRATPSVKIRSTGIAALFPKRLQLRAQVTLAGPS